MSERPRPRPTTKVYVGNIPPGTREKRLREIFEAFGPVGECSILKDYGFVVGPPQRDGWERVRRLSWLHQSASQVPSVLPPAQQHFENTEDADEAIQLLDGSDIDGNRISVEVGSRFGLA